MENLANTFNSKGVSETFAATVNGINACSKIIDEDFWSIVEKILDCKGKVISCGVGKSGIIARKMSATLSSTGTSSFFLCPSEAIHGDLGMIGENDVVVFISHSGNTNEIIKILPIIKNKIHVPTIAITGNASSILKKESELSLCYRIESEGYLNLPPMASTSVQLFIGDLIASALMEKKNFRDANFAVFHPGGNLGKKLLLSLENIIDTQDGNLDEVCCTNNVNLKELILLLSSGRKGAIIVISDSKEVLGIFTDGDLKRILIDSNYADFDSISLHEIMTKNPKTIYIDESPKQALAIMESHNITVLPVLNRGDNTVVGIINIHDLFKNGLK